MNAAITKIAGVCLLLLTFTCADYDMLDDDNKEIDRVNLEITAATDSSVTLRWTKYRDDDFMNYVVLYGTNDIVDWSDKTADSLVFDFDTVKTVHLLDDMTRYYFRVMVVNDDGIFSGSNTVDTITPENMTGKLKLTAPVLNGDGDILLAWTAAHEDFDKHAVYADTVRTVDTTDTLIATVYSDTSETISGLSDEKTWWLRVYAINDTAVVATSNIKSIYPAAGN
jgi:hypothetical protein